MAITLEEARKNGYYYAVEEILQMIEDAGVSYVLPPAGASTIGGVKAAAAVNDTSALTVSGADAAAVATSATTAVNTLRTALNSLLVALRASGALQQGA